MGRKASGRGIFSAQHGSWNRTKPVGARIMFTPLKPDGTADKTQVTYMVRTLLGLDHGLGLLGRFAVGKGLGLHHARLLGDAHDAQRFPTPNRHTAIAGAQETALNRTRRHSSTRSIPPALADATYCASHCEPSTCCAISTTM